MGLVDSLVLARVVVYTCIGSGYLAPRPSARHTCYYCAAFTISVFLFGRFERRELDD